MPTEIRQLVEEGAAKLARVSERPRFEAEILLASAIHRPRAYLLGHAEEQVRAGEMTDDYESKLTRRANGEPIAYILGEKEFWSLPIGVAPGVLIPRAETEGLVERALEHLPKDAPGSALDLATGSGAVALALAHERPNARIVATDVSEGAIALARKNAQRNAIGNVEFRGGHWYEPVRGERYTVIVCNPPYIAEGDPRVERSVRHFEPHDALYAGPSGLEALRQVIAGAVDHLEPGGWLLIEHGDTQGAQAREYFIKAGFHRVGTWRDLARLERYTEGRKADDLAPDR